MKPRVLQLIFTLRHGGAERLALTILDGLRGDCRGSVCGMFGNGGPLVPAAESLGIGHHSLHAAERGRVRSCLDLFRLLRRERIDIVHVQAGYLLQYLYLPARLAGARIVYTEHAKHSASENVRLRRLLRLLGSRMDAVTTVSHNLKDFFVNDMGFSAESVRVVPNAVDTARFRPDGPSERGRTVPCGPTVIGTVARMTEAKDHGNLLQAFKLLLYQRGNLLLALVGDGETRQEVEQQVRALGIGDHVLFLGSQERVPEFLRAMDVFVLPSMREGAPVSVLEAMACGVPTVATDVGGVREIIEDGVNGRVVPPRDHEALAEALLWLLERPEALRKFAAAGPEEVGRRFSREVMCRNYRQIYEQVMQS